MKNLRNKSLVLTVALAAFAGLTSGFNLAFAQTKLKPGWNLFSIKDDVEIGRRSAEEADRQLPIMRDREVTSYVTDLGNRLTSVAGGPEYPWRFRVVDTKDINAFALPGGFIYVNRGLIETCQNEAQLAGVIAHEISHVELRHGTNQASKAMLAQAPLAILGGTLGRGVGALFAQFGISFGLNTMFLKYSRNAETQADVRGVQILNDARYNTHEMAAFFEILNRQPGSRPPQFFSDHPNPENRTRRINEEISKLRLARNPTTDTARFRQIRESLKGMPASPVRERGRDRNGEPRRGGRPPLPSSDSRMYEHPDSAYRFQYPGNWRVSQEQGSGVTMSPEGGVSTDRGDVEYGVIVNIFDVQEDSHRRRVSLDDATHQLIVSIQRDNPYLSVRSDSERRGTLAGREAVSVFLTGTPSNRSAEKVRLVARMYGGNLLYILFIAPEEEYAEYERAFDRILNSFEVQ